MSQEQLADGLGLTFQQVQKYEKGTNRVSASKLQHISEILQVPISFFFEDGPSALVPADPALDRLNSLLNSKDAIDLVTAFNAVECPKVRQSILSLVRSLRGRSSDTTEGNAVSSPV